MIVTCERCATQFQLDDARVPEDGVRVRCSRCKHSFLVDPRGLKHEESDWSFNDDLGDGDLDEGLGLESAEVAMAGDPGHDAEDQPSDPTPAGDPLLAAEETEDSDELGSPVDWDILEDKRPQVARSEPAARVAASRAPNSLRPVLTGEDWDESEKAGVWLRRAGDTLGWLATAGLCVFGLFRGLASPQPATARPAAPVPGIEIEALRSRWIDNVSLGSLYVVSGRLRNTTPAAMSLPPLVLVLREAAGRETGEPLLVGAPKTSSLLREGSAEELHTLADAAQQSLPAGATLLFEVVAWPLPDAAEQFEIRARPSSSPATSGKD